MIQEAIILCGGLGTRLRSELPDHPKAMAPILGRPFLEYQLDHFLQEGVRHFILATGHLADQVEGHFGTHYRGIPLTFSRETRPLGTGGATRQALRYTHVFPLLVLNGDTFFPLALGPLNESHHRRGARVSMGLSCQPDGARYGRVDLDAQGRVIAFHEKGQAGPALINAGIYLIADNLDDLWGQNQETCSLERDVLPCLAQRAGLYGFPSEARFLDIGIPEDYKKSADYLREERS